MHVFYFILLIAFCLFPCRVNGQQNESGSAEAEVYVRVLPPTGLESSPLGTERVWKQIKEAVVLNGMHADTSPFVLETRLRLISCEATPSVPVRFIAEVEIRCSIVDRTLGRTLQQTSFQPKGIASTKEKAILAALQQIKARHPQLKKLLLGGKAKIRAAHASDASDVPETPQTPQTPDAFKTPDAMTLINN